MLKEIKFEKLFFLFQLFEILNYTRKIYLSERFPKKVSGDNWSQYLQKLPTPGQLLPYPLNVLQDGKLDYIDGVSSFPDFPPSAKIKGKANPLIPQKVTT